ncbi:unnamed protein product [Effrenium voratum]|nr:unnamed protein product [Effrenium voratum]
MAAQEPAPMCARAAGLMHWLLMFVGSLGFLNAASMAFQLQQQGHWASFRDVASSAGQAYYLALRVLLTPFEVGPAVPPELGIDAWVCFMPALLSFFLCVTASLGLRLMRPLCCGTARAAGARSPGAC